MTHGQLINEKLIEHLTESQKKAVFHKQGPLLILAGPGSGKTRVITYRIASLIDGGVHPYNICAITFTNKAAEEMRQRALALGASRGVHISTFHSLCVRILRQYAAQAGIRPNFSVFDASDQSRCIRRAIKDCLVDTSQFSPSKTAATISKLKNDLLGAEQFKAQANNFFTQTLAKIYECYQKTLEEQNALDFDDLLLKAAFLLTENEFVRKELSDRFEYLLIDEYQDTNQAQYKIAKALASQHRNICVTGDPDQSIYRWRGADISNILAFEQDWLEAVVIKLEENFRSTPNILKTADDLIAANKKRKPKRLIPTKPHGSEVVINQFEDEVSEAKAVAEQIMRLNQQGLSLSSIAVFYRVNAMSRVLEETFIRTRIPYQIIRGIEFYGRKEVKDLLCYLKVLVNPNDEMALLRCIGTPSRGIGNVTIERVKSFCISRNISLYEGMKLAERIESLSAGVKSKVAGFVNMMENFIKLIDGPVAELAEKVFDESGMKKTLESGAEPDNDAVENVNELINAAAVYDNNTPEPNLLDYIQQIALFSDTDTYDTSADRIALMTLHAAKGLEFENVFIIGLEEGLLPHERSADNEDEVEEERRLFFVGITRAKSNLYISYSRYRTIHGQLMRAIPSPFLYEIGHQIEELEPQTTLEYDTQDIEADYQPTPKFASGQLVRHKKFGMGAVKEFVDMGENSVIVIKFNSGMTKS
ncbi:MAG: UvrD-helicase domain-containing protein, partial [Phycisphaerae bacterium]|nr:UvrD-helicase domain-containing protein [Phycisphaerae bacterium]